MAAMYTNELRRLVQGSDIHVVGLVDDLSLSAYGTERVVYNQITSAARDAFAWLAERSLPVNACKCAWHAAPERLRLKLRRKCGQDGYTETSQHKHLGGQASMARRRCTKVGTQRLKVA
eukprot:4351965-Amphidinium_carterae.1